MKEKLIDNAVGAETALTELKGRLLQLANTLPPTNLGTFDYSYDNPLLGQRTSMTSALGTTSYTYDSNYQLTGATYPNAAPFNGEVHAWTYDNIGNRLTNTVNAATANYTYFKNGSNPLNGQRLQSDGTKTYTYDANGNITGDGTYTYTWDYENRLTGITGGGLTASYSYDYEGRRKSKTVNGITTTFLYDGSNLIRESSTTTADYVFGSAIDEPLAQSTAGAVFYYAVDVLGSTTALDDAAGTVQNAYTYDVWGIIRNQVGSTQNPFIYTSREKDEAGLYFYRARHYNPSIGRFISEDRRRFDAGINFYSYVLNDPVIYADPSGEFVVPFPIPPTSTFPPPPAPPPAASCPPDKNCDRYGKGTILYKICMGTPNGCWSNCVRKCLLDRYEEHSGPRYLFIDHPICFWICPTTCPVFI